jgi:hypothetical protein
LLGQQTDLAGYVSSSRPKYCGGKEWTYKIWDTGLSYPDNNDLSKFVRNGSSDLNRTQRASIPVTDWLETRVTTKPTTTTMNDSQHRARIDSRKQRRQATERRRLRAFTASDASGGGGLTEKEATKLITSSKIKNTQ